MTTQSSVRTFEWEADGKQSPHLLRAMATKTGGTKFLLLVKKPKGHQALELEAPIGLDDFAAAWNSKRWEAVDRIVTDEDFAETRFARTKSGFVVWRVHHVAGVPYDGLFFFSGTEAQMRQFYAAH